jgi:endonuclease/exonuclease/phosphatase family metal-dependent hydrolase
MKILSYNIWNNDRDFTPRLELLAKTIREIDPDIIALQEVRNYRVVQYIQSETRLEHYCWQPYPDCEEGLAIFSKYPITFNWNNWDNDMDFHNSGVVNLSVSLNNKKIGITNVHLDYKRALYRELEIVKAVKRIEGGVSNDYELMLGDFNTYPISSVHGYLTGTQSLHDHSTGWIDLFDSYSARVNYNQSITLDFYNNPRWDSEYALDIPGRFDWILLMNPYPNEYPVLKEFRIIGDKRIDGMTPSDHYGVFCELEI